MALDLVFKDVKPSEELVNRLQAKVARLDRLIHRPPPVRMTLLKTRTSYACIATMHLRGHDFVARGEGDDLFEASDEAVHRLESQVKNQRERTVSTKRHGRARVAASGG